MTCLGHEMQSLGLELDLRLVGFDLGLAKQTEINCCVTLSKSQLGQTLIACRM